MGSLTRPHLFPLATEVAGLTPEVHLIQSLVLFFLIADIIFIPANRGYEIPACPKALPDVPHYRSFPFEGYVILFRYDGGTFENSTSSRNTAITGASSEAIRIMVSDRSH